MRGSVGAAGGGLEERLVLGVDPGLAETGYACVRQREGRIEVVETGVIRTDSGLALERRLDLLFQGIEGVFSRVKPEVMAMEEYYSVPRHPGTAILMAHARGVICLCAARNGVEVVSYAVREAKQAVTGSGKASKEQVQRMVAVLAHLKQPVKSEHVGDALALALCHCLVRRGLSLGKRGAGGREGRPEPGLVGQQGVRRDD